MFLTNQIAWKTLFGNPTRSLPLHTLSARDNENFWKNCYNRQSFPCHRLIHWFANSKRPIKSTTNASHHTAAAMWQSDDVAI
jgi:hypothetical protein